jgi:transcriptional regulator with XRE-family HTH domain
MDTKRIGQRIMVLRESKGLSRVELAEKAGLHYNAIHRIETGGLGEQAQLAPVVKIAHVLGVSLDDLTRGCV